MMAAAPARFTFDLDLGRRQERKPPGAPRPPGRQLIAEARAGGLCRGLRRRRAQRHRQGRPGLAAAAETLADRTAAMAAALDDARKQAICARPSSSPPASPASSPCTCSPASPTAEIEALIAECLASLDGVPHLVIRCHPDLADARPRDRHRPHGDLRLYRPARRASATPTSASATAGIEWVDGGLVRDIGAISGRDRQRIAAYLAARGSQAHAEETEQ